MGQEDPVEEGMATHSCILAWRIPWTEEPVVQSWVLIGRTDAEAETPILWPPDAKN